MAQFILDPSTGQLTEPSIGRKLDQPAEPDPRLDALFTDQDTHLTEGGQAPQTGPHPRYPGAETSR